MGQGRCLEQLGLDAEGIGLAEWAGAGATLNAAIALEPDNPDRRWCLALTKFLQGDDAKAWPDDAALC